MCIKLGAILLWQFVYVMSMLEIDNYFCKDSSKRRALYRQELLVRQTEWKKSFADSNLFYKQVCIRRCYCGVMAVCLCCSILISCRSCLFDYSLLSSFSVRALDFVLVNNLVSTSLSLVTYFIGKC